MGRAIIVIATLAVAVAPAAARDRVVAALPQGGAAMSAWQGHVVFSAATASGAARWALMHATAHGVQRLSVPTENAPFDADVGPDAAGRPVAVYSRCPYPGQIFTPFARLPGTAHCHIWEVRLDRPGAQPTIVRSLVSSRYSDAAPTIWRGRIAFGRVLNHGTLAAIFVQRRPGSRSLLRLGRGTIPVCPPGTPHDCYRVAAPAAMDLGPTRLGFVWALSGGNAYAQDDEELWIEGLGGATGRLLDSGGAGECGTGPPSSFSFYLFGQPAVSHGRVSYLAERGDCWLTDSLFAETGPTWRTLRRRDTGGTGPPRTLAYDATRDSTGWWWIRGAETEVNTDGTDSDPCAPGGCDLVHSTIALRRVHVQRRPRPPVES